MLRTILRTFTVLAVACSVVNVAQANVVLEDGVYQLNSHRDGSARPPLYGLRLDGLGTGDQNDIYTFDFNGPGAAMFMDLDVANNSIRIFGTAFGGLDVGNTYDNIANGQVGLWNIDFTYTSGIQVLGDGEIIAGPMNAANNGSITPIVDATHFTSGVFSGGNAIPLVDYNGAVNDPTFHIDFGHRTPGDVISGWGWVNHGSYPHQYDSDWLFEVGPRVPVPGAVYLAALGIGFVGARSRRKKA